jgi:hypothetical protein
MYAAMSGSSGMDIRMQARTWFAQPLTGVDVILEFDVYKAVSRI